MNNTAAKRMYSPGGKQTFTGIKKFGARPPAKSDAFKATPERSRMDVVDTMASLFEPDILAAAQYFDTYRRKTLIEPEKRLLAAILEDAIDCFYDNVSAESGRRKKLFDDAEEWLLEERVDWIFSFRNVCDLLGLSAEYLRSGLMRWKEKNRAQDLDGWHRINMAV